MRTGYLADRYVIAREDNVVRVDFRREPDPPAPQFPGAAALRNRNAPPVRSGLTLDRLYPSSGDRLSNWRARSCCAANSALRARLAAQHGPDDVDHASERRRRWSDDEWTRMLAETKEPSAAVAEVARRADVCATLVYKWRREARKATSTGFAPVVIETAAAAERQARSSGANLECSWRPAS